MLLHTKISVHWSESWRRRLGRWSISCCTDLVVDVTGYYIAVNWTGSWGRRLRRWRRCCCTRPSPAYSRRNSQRTRSWCRSGSGFDFTKLSSVLNLGRELRLILDLRPVLSFVLDGLNLSYGLLYVSRKTMYIKNQERKNEYWIRLLITVKVVFPNKIPTNANFAAICSFCYNGSSSYIINVGIINLELHIPLT